MLIYHDGLNQLGQTRCHCLLPERRKSWLIIDKYRYWGGNTLFMTHQHLLSVLRSRHSTLDWKGGK